MSDTDLAAQRLRFAFVKILSYLLANKTVGGKKAVEYFPDKFDDPMMFAQLESCVRVPTETILFNIDSKSPLTKDKTAILRVFAKVFYEHLGFYGSDLKVAKLEQFISRSGKTKEFMSSFERINGGSWEDSRDSFAFFEDDIVEAMSEALGMSETAARNWFNGEEEIELSIEQLVKEIKEYIDSKGKDLRLLFMIDEVGQYIGSDSDLMLNLQTMVEEIGTKCGGRVWVMVTSQEAIDSITKIKPVKSHAVMYISRILRHIHNVAVLIAGCLCCVCKAFFMLAFMEHSAFRVGC